jgi:myo-inositol-1(or 4)-monophosphatase
VDPLDGTFNFSRGLPIAAVSIGLCRGTQPILGVIYDFMHDELFSGVVGIGATCNGKSIVVSGITNPAQGALATGLPVTRSYKPEDLQGFLLRAQTFKKIRMLGSAAISLASVACGRLDAYEEESIMLWDVIAGVAIVQAAGGFTSMRPREGRPWAFDVRCAGSQPLLETLNF